MTQIPDKPVPDGLEPKWAERWEAEGTYRFDRERARPEIFSIDTPPPTVSGELHLGHIFSYTHTDAIARYQRMKGLAVFYPIGFDDNGLPTERRVQNYYGVRCDPTLPHDPGFTPPEQPFDPPELVSKRNFIELCERLTLEDEAVFTNLFRTLGLSVDWSINYRTIDQHARQVAQRAFLRNLGRGEAYTAEAPVLWDIDFRTAVAQAELEDREERSALHRIDFHLQDGSPITIETTRPELIVSCVALVAHPDDDRYRSLVGTTAASPLFGVEVPVVTHDLAAPDKGTGIAQICTFGDTTDVVWWRDLDLPTRAALQRDGRLVSEVPEWITTDGGRAAFTELAGKTAKQARRRMVELLAESGDLRGDPEPITHVVKFYEKGDRPLEIVTSRQWYIHNGGRDPALREDLLLRGKEIRWIPDFMRVRYEHWVNGLTGDWLISRQRYLGVPIPVWYAVGADGDTDYDHPIVPSESDLPIDPATSPAPGYEESQRGRPGGFVADPDVMDTWATSSLTPQIAAGWEDDPDLFARVFPMDLRPQAHDIIRTWLFATITRSHFEHDSVPWSNAAISGWIVDPDRKKMSKSKGNVVTPMALLEQYGSDAVRYWAASGRPGADTAFDEAQMKVGRRLVIKVLNASRFALGLGEGAAGDVTEALDRSMLAGLAAVVEEATSAFDGFDYARALDRTESAFWAWCDDYLELVKGRAYGDGPGAGSAHRALRSALSVFLRLLAPLLPFATEEVWSWWQQGSIHRSSWPAAAEFAGLTGDLAVLDAASWVLGEIRKAKSDAKLSMRTPVESVEVRAPDERVAALELARDDLSHAGGVERLEMKIDGESSVGVVLAATA
ncbi:MAG TPA: valine--tRNA ligase [Acidimicrobiia bacterium]|nr:valine--tRNA ligase [Acidimicrobiia bacterium]